MRGFRGENKAESNRRDYVSGVWGGPARARARCCKFLTFLTLAMQVHDSSWRELRPASFGVKDCAGGSTTENVASHYYLYNMPQLLV